MTQSALFICGSLNQTIQMHEIAKQMGEHECYFTPYYADGIVNLVAKAGLLNFTVLGGRHMADTRQYLADHHLPMDERGAGRDYDLVVTCSDLIVQKNIRKKRIILVQEGITEPEGLRFRLCKTFPFLPRYIADTSVSGLSNAYDIFCVASQGYSDLFVHKGVRPEKIAVTGIPNFDNLQRNYQNDFPYAHYVLVATTPYRETFRIEDRATFLRYCGKVAAGRLMIFKLHPLENARRATREIKKRFPDAIVISRGDINPMIANADVVITQQSSCTFVAVGLEKETYTFLNVAELRRLMPIQNSGTSARQIATIAQRLLNTPMPVLEKARNGYRPRPRWESFIRW